MRRELRRRLSSLEAIVRPADSVASKIAALAPSEWAIYRDWHEDYLAWIRGFDDPDGAYVALISGNCGPEMPVHLGEKLLGPTISISPDDTVESAAKKYLTVLRG